MIQKRIMLVVLASTVIGLSAADEPVADNSQFTECMWRLGVLNRLEGAKDVFSLDRAVRMQVEEEGNDEHPEHQAFVYSLKLKKLYGFRDSGGIVEKLTELARAETNLSAQFLYARLVLEGVVYGDYKIAVNLVKALAIAEVWQPDAVFLIKAIYETVPQALRAEWHDGWYAPNADTLAARVKEFNDYINETDGRKELYAHTWAHQVTAYRQIATKLASPAK